VKRRCGQGRGLILLAYSVNSPRSSDCIRSAPKARPIVRQNEPCLGPIGDLSVMDSQRVSYVDYMEGRFSPIMQGFAGWARIRFCVDRHRTLRGCASDSAGIPGVRASDSAWPRIAFGVGPRPSPRKPAGFDPPPRIELCAGRRSAIRPRIELCAAPAPVIHRQGRPSPTGPGRNRPQASSRPTHRAVHRRPTGLSGRAGRLERAQGAGTVRSGSTGLLTRSMRPRGRPGGNLCAG
jgi:hypothetical protein